MQTTLELLFRILVAGALGAAIGYERDLHRRPAGLRTHMLVAMASAAFMVISTVFTHHQGYVDHALVKVDASRIASEVVSGAGFIAGGAILRSGPTVQGLTTAAGLWLVTAIGLAAGGGMFVVAAGVCALGVLALWGLRSVEIGGGDLREHGKVSVELSGQQPLAALRKLIEEADARVVTHDYRRGFAEASTEVTFFVSHGKSFDTDVLVQKLAEQPGMRSVRVEKLA